MPLNPQQLRIYRGHPTAAGPNEEWVPTRQGREDAADGMPGVPRVRRHPDGGLAGIPGPTPSGPLQPGVIYNEGEDTEAPKYGNIPGHDQKKAPEPRDTPRFPELPSNQGK